MMLEITLNHYLVLSRLILCIGFLGIIVNYKSIISVLVSLELMLLSVNINFIAFSRFHNDFTGQVFSIFIIAVSAAEAAIGLSLLLVYYKKHSSIALDDINGLNV